MKKTLLTAFLIVTAVAITGLVVLTQYTGNISDLESPKHYTTDPLLSDMTLSLSSGEILGSKISGEGVIIDINSDGDSRLVIDRLMYTLERINYNSTVLEYMILVDGEEVEVDRIGFDIAAISVQEDSKKVEILAMISGAR